MPEKGCFFEDDFCNAFIAKAKEADGFIFGSPVYYAHPVGSNLYWIGSSILPDLLLPLNRRLRSLLPAEAEPRRHSMS